MSTSQQWQLAHEAAQRYQQILVPFILGPAAGALVEWAVLQHGETVVDVGCGTGAATREAAGRVGPSGHVIGADVNEAMIGVAKALPAVEGATIDWRVCDAAALPLDDASADAVLCAQTLQFVPDRVAALSEMHRVLKSGGRVAVSTWCEIEENPYFHELFEAVSSHVGPDTAKGLGAAFGLTSPSALHELIELAGFRDVEIKVRQLDLSLPELTDFVPRHVSATPMAAGFAAAPEAARRAVVDAMSERLASHATAAGVTVPFRTHFALATK